MAEIPAEAVHTPQQVMALVLSGHEDVTDPEAAAVADDILHALAVAGYKIAREASSPVQGPVKECPQAATGSTESAELASCVPPSPGSSEGISEPRGVRDKSARQLRAEAAIAQMDSLHLRAERAELAIARVRRAMAKTLLQGPNAVPVVRLADLRAALDGPAAVSEQTGSGDE